VRYPEWNKGGKWIKRLTCVRFMYPCYFFVVSVSIRSGKYSGVVTGNEKRGVS
jgi:hypothetical protein